MIGSRRATLAAESRSGGCPCGLRRDADGCRHGTCDDAGESCAIYTFRRAAAGSIRAARHAGPAIDSAAVIPSTIVTNANVVRSSGLTPDRRSTVKPSREGFVHDADGHTIA